MSPTVSPDGKNVYVTGFNNNSVAVFSRNSITGALTFIEVHKQNIDGVDGLDSPTSMKVSPDGKNVYVAGFVNDAIAVFSRNATTGALTFVEVIKDNTNGVDGLDGPSSVAVSSDGKNVYAAGLYDHALAVFSRNSTTGKLTFVEVQKQNINGVDGLTWATSVIVSLDKKHVYVTGYLVML